MDVNFEIIKKIPLFKGIREDLIPDILDNLHVSVKNFEKGQFILQEDDPVRWFGLVLSGKVIVMQEDFFGNRTIINVIEPPQMFAEAFVCAGIETMPVSVMAESNAKIMLIPKQYLFSDDKSDYSNQLIKNLLMVVSNRNLFLNQKVRYMSKKTTREMLLSYLSDQANKNNSNSFVIPFDRQGLADYLGVERSAMAAEISKLVKEGLIETKKSYFKIL